MFSVRCLAPLASAALLLALPAAAEEAVCAPVAKVPLERHLRQLSLDLLGRPPTMEEYKTFQAKGSVTAADVRKMMGEESFYARMREFHRALLRSNINSSVQGNGDYRVSGTPLSFAGNNSNALRGGQSQRCDGEIAQDSCKANPQDAHQDNSTAPACRDAQGVPLPVSYDYDTNFYQCRQLDVNATAPELKFADCNALKANATYGKYVNFCDNRYLASAGKSVGYLCLPDPNKNTTNVLVPSPATGVITSWVQPAGGTGTLTLDRCGFDISTSQAGVWSPRRGCVQREGYVTTTVQPYWSTTTEPVKVCAIEAQDRPTNPYTGAACETSRFNGDRSCGCGDKMRRCEITEVHTARVAAFNEEPLYITDSVVRNDEPYFNILTTRRSYVNGPLSEFYRQRQGVGVFSVKAPADSAVLPSVTYASTTQWSEYVRDNTHSGVLTTPAFLYRFPTQRARVNEFYEAFLCKHFAPAADASLPPPDDACNRENNLAKRCGCNYCHATIEPTGAHWGRYAERSALFLSADQFPRLDVKCRDCAINGDTSCGGECSQYVMQAFDGDGANSLGLLKTYLYRTTDEEKNIEGGPQALVKRMMETGDLERCTVKRVWNEFLGRAMTAEEQRMYLQTLSQDFAKNNHSLKGLIEQVVMSDAYRRID
ncbi:DUF1585 domain-containing protein [Corallococcus carmarthensis]|uniref:DUF1585 domain-containing protein n=2 Tax=Corallococcus carmarthensis TaxID=2316728 RepID=A0A3A8KB00_9BACT|nr:DUF1585 domain-containing protein [Corallococcus carmarthensis]RKH05180.1 DUF1585 domain-containing protein [Corallococcus carmarthensis]